MIGFGTGVDTSPPRTILADAVQRGTGMVLLLSENELSQWTVTADTDQRDWRLPLLSMVSDQLKARSESASGTLVVRLLSIARGQYVDLLHLHQLISEIPKFTFSLRPCRPELKIQRLRIHFLSSFSVLIVVTPFTNYFRVSIPMLGRSWETFNSLNTTPSFPLRESAAFSKSMSISSRSSLLC